MALEKAYIDRVYSDPGGYTGNTYYYRLEIIVENQLYIWDNVAGALALSPTWANSVINMSDNGSTGKYPIVIPASLPAGTFTVTVYQRAGVSPANTDDVKDTHQLKHGSIFGF